MKNIKSIGKVLLLLTSLTFVCGICTPGDDFYLGEPIEGVLDGKWRLQRLETPSGIFEDSAIGFKEIWKNENFGGDNIDSIFRNDTLFARHVFTRNPGAQGSASKREITVTYRDGNKRFFKFSESVDHNTGRPSQMIASEYLKQLGGPADTVRYIYVQE